MASRIIQNNFVAGEISPELHGRHDIKAYFQGAAKLENFVPRRTGGVRKRAGTQFMLKLHDDSATKFRAIPFFFDRTTFCELILFKKTGDAKLYYALHKQDADGGTTTERTTDYTTATSLGADSDLDELKFKQLGDTLFFTAAGRRAFKAEIFMSEMRVEWEQLSGTITPAAPPALNATSTGFKPSTDEGYVESSRKYALYGMKSGVFSAPQEKDVTISLPWISGARVNLSFTPRWDQHDYYILGRLQGANYGIVSKFFPNLQSGSNADSTFADTNAAETGTVGGVGYTAGSDGASVAWKRNPDSTNSAASDTAWHVNAKFVTGKLTATYKSASYPILSLRIWFGAKVRKTSDLPGTETVSEIGVTGATTVTLNGVVAGADVQIAQWTANAIYSEASITLAVESPVVLDTATYSVEIEAEDGTTPVLVRGIVLASDMATQSFIDDNINVTDITGLQERLVVGDSGMDCDLCDVWEQRLVMASSRNLPFSVWFSAVGDIYNFYASRPQTMADAFSVSIPPVAASRILHMVSGRWLMFFTEAGEYMCGGGAEGFGYATINIRKTSGVGAHEDVPPIQTESQLLFVASDARSVYEMRYDLSQDNVVPQEISALAHHLTENASIVKVAYQRFPDSVLWCLLSDGSLISMTYMPEQQVIAWGRHSFGATNMTLVDIHCPGSSFVGTGVETTSHVVLTWTCADEPGSVWLETMRPNVTLDSPPVAAARCADHLGYAVADYPDDKDPATDVVAELVTLRPESPDFNSMALAKTILDCAVRLRRSGSVSIAPLRGSLPAQSSKATVVEDNSVELVTGDVKVLPRSYHNDDGQMVVKSADAWPCEVESVLFNLDLGVAGGGEGGQR